MYTYMHACMYIFLHMPTYINQILYARFFSKSNVSNINCRNSNITYIVTVDITNFPTQPYLSILCGEHQTPEGVSIFYI
jgi:hypothetical protein